jgi:CubicO group peptidase (beta-lactamase class C family)
MKKSTYMRNMGTSVLILLMLTFVLSFTTQAQTIAAKQLAAAFDKLLTEQFKPGGTGCAALVAVKGQIIYKKAFGMANLELNVPMQPDMIFRIGSITKQFTAVSILQLMEQGKLSLQDDITKFIPDYPTNGYKITIEHLLTHTSGIKSYTSVPEFQEYIRDDKKPEDVIKLFRNQPMEFAPGTKWNYNNSGYFLLGYIIEKVSGKTYPEYIEENLFKPLGMSNSLYGSDSKIIRNRAWGYQPEGDEVVNADMMSMTLPYSAGSIQSTVEDLFKWNQALHSYKLVKKETLEKAFTEYKLANGKGTAYGYGWMLKQLQGSPTIEHGGAINGYLANAIYLPDEDIFVAVFSNNSGKSPDLVSNKMAAIALGKPYNMNEIPADEATLEQYTGVYENEDGDQRMITREGNKLFSQRSGGMRYIIKLYGADKFFFDNSLTLIIFKRDASGRITEAVTDDRGIKAVWKKTDKPLPARTAITVPEKVLMQYVGEYELQPGFVITVTLDGNRLFTQATGQAKFEIFAESEFKFFLKVVDAQLEFVKDETGKVTGAFLYQGGQKLEAKKIK